MSTSIRRLDRRGGRGLLFLVGTVWLSLAPGVVLGQGAAPGAWSWGSNAQGQLGTDGVPASSSAALQTASPSATANLLAAGAGYGSTVVLREDGGLLAWGANWAGQLGSGEWVTTPSAVPAWVVGPTEFVAVASGYAHVLALHRSGTVRAWGANALGQVGDGTRIDRQVMTPVPGLANVARIAAGVVHSLAVKTDGSVWTWGYNASGQLGDGTRRDRSKPTLVPGLSGVVAVAAGFDHSLALKGDGTVWAWGGNWAGQLGDGTYTRRHVPVQVQGLHDIVTIASGWDHGLAVSSTGQLWAWGANHWRQLGDGTTRATVPLPALITALTHVVQVAGGERHTLAIDEAHAVWAWGAGMPAAGLTGEGDVVPLPQRVAGVDNARAIAAGSNHSVVIVATPPELQGVWPGRGPSVGGTLLRLSGSHLVASEIVFTIGGVAAPVTVDDEGLKVTTPPHAGGLVDVTVTTPYGQSTCHGGFAYLNAAAGEGLGFLSAMDGYGVRNMPMVPNVSVYRPGTGEWIIATQLSYYPGPQGFTVTFGTPGDEPLRGDFDGDGRRDPAVYRPSTGTWFWLESSGNYSRYGWRGWGEAAKGDVPVPGDYDGDGRTDPTVFRRATGTWFVLKSSSHYKEYAAYGWGAPDDQPVPADYDGDGTSDIAVYRSSTGEWFVLPSSSGFTTAWPTIDFGEPGDVPVRGDFDGDWKHDIAVYRPSTHTWLLLRSSSANSAHDEVVFGAPGDLPVPGEYNVMGLVDAARRTYLCVYRPSTGTWFVRYLPDLTLSYGWGAPGDIPLGGQR